MTALRCSTASPSTRARSSYNSYAIKDGEGKRTLIGSIPIQELAYKHSFGMTQQYIVLVEFPLVMNPLQLLISWKPFIENYHWKPELGTRFLVIDKEDGQVIHTAHSEAFFAFHHINAFERDGEVIVDLATLHDDSIIDSTTMLLLLPLVLPVLSVYQEVNRRTHQEL